MPIGENEKILNFPIILHAFQKSLTPLEATIIASISIFHLLIESIQEGSKREALHNFVILVGDDFRIVFIITFYQQPSTSQYIIAPLAYKYNI